MAYRDILVYLDPTDDTDNRLDLAVSMAALHEARLIGVDASSDAAFGPEWRDRTAELEDRFKSAIKHQKVVGEFHTETGAKARAGHPYAHCVDLVIAPQPQFESRDLVIKAVPEEVLLTCGAPVLLLPYAWKPHAVGQDVVVAWNASREATRAIHDAMPILRKARTVTVFTFASRMASIEAEQRMVLEHLHRHSVPAKGASWLDTGDVTPVEALFASLDTVDADLIVAGAFGHSPLLEGLVGGTSQALIQEPVLPLLMSH